MTLACSSGVTLEIDSRQAGAASERRYPDAGDLQTVDRAGNDHYNIEKVVSCDGDGAVVDAVIELGLHCGGQRQNHQERHEPFGPGDG